MAKQIGEGEYMSQQYNRMFITLKNDRPGYEFYGRQPSGRCVIETRGSTGKITVMVQDLKPGVLYKGYMIKGKDDGSAGFPFGTISVDARGKGELKLEFDPNNVCQSGFNVGDVNTVAVIVKTPAGDQGVVSPLVGFAEDMVRWKHGFTDLAASPTQPRKTETDPAPKRRDVLARVTSEEKAMLLGPLPEYGVQAPDEFDGGAPAEEAAEQEAPVEEEVLVEEAVIAEEVFAEEAPADEVFAEEEAIVNEEVITEEAAFAEQEAAPAPGTEAAWEATNGEAAAGGADAEATAANIHETFKTMAKKFSKELESLEYYDFPDSEEDQSAAAQANEKQEKPGARAESVQDDIGYIFENNLSLTPFKRQSRPVEWVCISVKELVLLPLDCWGFMNQPFIQLAHKKYNHLILGRESEGASPVYYVGVPDQYRHANKEHIKSIGFTQFKCCDDVIPADGEYGYWILDTRA